MGTALLLLVILAVSLLNIGWLDWTVDICNSSDEKDKRGQIQGVRARSIRRVEWGVCVGEGRIDCISKSLLGASTHTQQQQVKRTRDLHRIF